MVRNRIYNSENKVVGTLHTDNSKQLIGLQFSQTSKLRNDFIIYVNKFLKENGLKPISSNASFRKHHNSKEYIINTNGIDFYYKTINPRTQKLEIKSIKEINKRIKWD